MEVWWTHGNNPRFSFGKQPDKHGFQIRQVFAESWMTESFLAADGARCPAKPTGEALTDALRTVCSGAVRRLRFAPVTPVHERG